MTELTTLQEVKDAIDAGKDVRCFNDSYKAFKDNIGQYLIEYTPNGHTVGLTGRAGSQFVNILNSNPPYYVKD